MYKFSLFWALILLVLVFCVYRFFTQAKAMSIRQEPNNYSCGCVYGMAVYWLVLHQVYSCLSLSIANFYWNHQFWMIQSICVSIGLNRTETKHRKWCTLIFHSIHFKQNETLSNATDILWPFGLSYGSKPYVCYCQFLINLSLSIVSSLMLTCCPKFVFVDGKKHIVCVCILSRGHSF